MPKFQAQDFYLLQIVLGGVFLAITWFFLKPGQKGSNFKVTEAELRKDKPRTQGPDLGEARIATPKLLTGIRLDVPAHQLLGVSPIASEAEIQKAYRDLMKIYHPDRVGRPGTREWQDAQKIAEALNAAKTQLLARARSHSSSSSSG